MNGSAPGAIYALIVLFAINLMNFFDRNIFGAIGELSNKNMPREAVTLAD